MCFLVGRMSTTSSQEEQGEVHCGICLEDEAFTAAQAGSMPILPINTPKHMVNENYWRRASCTVWLVKTTEDWACCEE
ncbi:hypothetical protein PM082_024959 [Marasmius tenuissimus]|nr:hypothetical protein PM082_024959 [Marasmius tenuissimus]